MKESKRLIEPEATQMSIPKPGVSTAPRNASATVNQEKDSKEGGGERGRLKRYEIRKKKRKKCCLDSCQTALLQLSLKEKPMSACNIRPTKCNMYPSEDPAIMGEVITSKK